MYVLFLVGYHHQHEPVSLLNSPTLNNQFVLHAVKHHSNKANTRKIMTYWPLPILTFRVLHFYCCVGWDIKPVLSRSWLCTVYCTPWTCCSILRRWFCTVYCTSWTIVYLNSNCAWKCFFLILQPLRPIYC